MSSPSYTMQYKRKSRQPAKQDLALTAEHCEAQGDGIVSPLGLLDILPDVTDGHSGLFHAADDLQPLQIGVLKHADAARQPLLQTAAGPPCHKIAVSKRAHPAAKRCLRFLYAHSCYLERMCYNSPIRRWG